jgi:hypothetical protein
MHRRAQHIASSSDYCTANAVSRGFSLVQQRSTACSQKSKPSQAGSAAVGTDMETTKSVRQSRLPTTSHAAQTPTQSAMYYYTQPSHPALKECRKQVLLV